MNMDNKQVKLLIDLAKKLKKEVRGTNEILHTFVSAGILKANGDFTEHYTIDTAIKTTKKS
jgi:hypothetical protein